MKRFSFSPTSILIWLWLLLVLGFGAFSGYLLATTIHELGHYLTAKRLGYKLSKFSLSGYGVSLSYFEEKIDPKEEIKIALAGPAFNLFSALLVCGMWWLCPSVYFFTYNFVFCSVILALTNLLPAYPLDGGRIFMKSSNIFFKEKTSQRFTLIFNLFLIVLFFSLFIWSCTKNFNPTLLLFSIFLIGGIIDLKFSSKYEKLCAFQKKTKNFCKVYCLSADPSTTLSKLIKKMSTSKKIVFCLTLPSGKTILLSEEFIQKLSQNFPIQTRLENIFKNN